MTIIITHNLGILIWYYIDVIFDITLIYWFDAYEMLERDSVSLLKVNYQLWKKSN